MRMRETTSYDIHFVDLYTQKDNELECESLVQHGMYKDGREKRVSIDNYFNTLCGIESLHSSHLYFSMCLWIN